MRWEAPAMLFLYLTGTSYACLRLALPLFVVMFIAHKTVPRQELPCSIAVAFATSLGRSPPAHLESDRSFAKLPSMRVT